MPGDDARSLSRRTFVAGSLAAAAALGTVAACSDGGDDDGAADRAADDPPTDSTPAEGDSTASGDAPPVGALPAAAATFAWIEEVFDQGVRRPGYPADDWAEGWVFDHFERIGLEDVRREPITVRRWEPVEWRLEVTAAGSTEEVECFPVPYASPVDDLEVDLVAYDAAAPDAVAGRAALFDAPLLRLPPDVIAGFGSVPEDWQSRVHDPEGTFPGTQHVVPFAEQFQAVMEPSIDAGAVAFIGTLSDYPGDSCRYFVPYDAHTRPIPGVWVKGSDGARLRDLLAAGPVRVRLHVESTEEDAPSSNVVGELPGADDETVIIASHHDGPWASAVEDASGIALVLAQATYWAGIPAEERPHRMVFLLQGGHMAGGAGLAAYVGEHREELDRCVLQIHLEHAALDVVEAEDGSISVGDLCTPRWWFTSRIPPLEDAVLAAIEAEGLGRSLLVAPDALGAMPTTDGALFYPAGVPIVHHLAAPHYLFDEMDTLDKIDRGGLEPLGRATIRIVESTAGVSAAELRAQQVTGP